MKKIILSTMILAFGLTSMAFTDPDFTLTVVVKQMKNTEGQLRVSLFNSESDWLSKGEVQTSQIENQEVVTFSFKNVPAGKYAVSVIHDANSNGDLDTGTFGIPVEAYGFSNDARGMFGPPSFDESRFEITSDHKIIINIE